jgi:hypothetical protein
MKSVASKSASLPKILVRLPHDVKEWLAGQSDYHQSSQTSEIVRAVRERMERAGMKRNAARW